MTKVFLTVLTVLLTLAVSAFVGYGFAAYEFKGKRILLVIRSSDKYTLINLYGDNYSLFIASRKYFIEGMTAGAVKG